jgi:hypothetical protein
MDENIALTISKFLDSSSKFNYLNYYFQQELNETGDEEFVYKLECLYEWWEQEQRELPARDAEEILEWEVLMRIREEQDSLFEQIFFA